MLFRTLKRCFRRKKKRDLEAKDIGAYAFSATASFSGENQHECLNPAVYQPPNFPIPFGVREIPSFHSIDSPNNILTNGEHAQRLKNSSSTKSTASELELESLRISKEQKSISLLNQTINGAIDNGEDIFEAVDNRNEEEYEIFGSKSRREAVLESRALGKRSANGTSIRHFHLHAFPLTFESLRVIDKIEQTSRSLRGPKWVVASHLCDHKIMKEGQSCTVARAMNLPLDHSSAVENTLARLRQVGSNIARKVLSGVSPVLDLKFGTRDLNALRKNLICRAEKLPFDAEFLRPVDFSDLEANPVPIFAISYRHTRFSKTWNVLTNSWENDSWRMSDEQIDELYAILSLVVHKKRVRIWVDRLVPEDTSEDDSFTNSGILPFTIFPVVALGCRSHFNVNGADDRLWLEIERHMAYSASGIIFMEGKIQCSRYLPLKKYLLESSLDHKLQYIVGENYSVLTCLSIFAESFLQGKYTAVMSNMDDFENLMPSLAKKILSGHDLEKCMSSSNEMAARKGIESHPSNRSVGSESMRLMKNSLSRFAECTKEKDLTSWIGISNVLHSTMERPVRQGSDKAWWDGTSEFVVDKELATLLDMELYERKYLCFYEEGKREMFVWATLESPTKLHGVLIVTQDKENEPAYGTVMKIMTNVSRFERVEESSKEFEDFIKPLSRFILGSSRSKLNHGENTEDCTEQILKEGMMCLYEVHSNIQCQRLRRDELFWR